jgi:hypothetical protein
VQVVQVVQVDGRQAVVAVVAISKVLLRAALAVLVVPVTVASTHGDPHEIRPC